MSRGQDGKERRRVAEKKMNESSDMPLAVITSSSRDPSEDFASAASAATTASATSSSATISAAITASVATATFAASSVGVAADGINSASLIELLSLVVRFHLYKMHDRMEQRRRCLSLEIVHSC